MAVKVSLVATVKDAAGSVGPFLESVRAQTRPPDELVIVDGGSTDGTLEILRAAEDVALLEAPGANIARGRNLGIGAATHDVIAVTDADCVLAPDWLEHLTRAMAAGADVAMGYTRAVATSFLETCAAAVAVPPPSEVNPATFMPSSRSVAFRREALERAGGYPEWLDVGEDMYLNHRLRERYAEMIFVPEAVVYWRMRRTLGETWRQYFRYAEGDARGGMYPERHAVRFAAYGALAWALASRSRRALAALGLLAALHAARPVRRSLALLRGRPAERAAAVVAVPALMAMIDLAKMAGYAAGRLRGRP